MMERRCIGSISKIEEAAIWWLFLCMLKGSEKGDLLHRFKRENELQ